MTNQPLDPTDGPPGQNTDRELWRERVGDYYADSIFVTESGGIGINAGGMVYVKPLREWHRLASYSVDFPSISRVVPPEGGPRPDGCPCTLIEPCTSACSCADSYMSGGCLRCCKYGSPEQRLAAANDIASRLRASGAGTRQEEPDWRQCFRWAYQLLLALAKRRLDDSNREVEGTNNWPAGQRWDELVGSSHGVFLHGAREEAGIPHDAFLELVRSGRVDVEDLYDAATSRVAESRPNE